MVITVQEPKPPPAAEPPPASERGKPSGAPAAAADAGPQRPEKPLPLSMRPIEDPSPKGGGRKSKKNAAPPPRPSSAKEHAWKETDSKSHDHGTGKYTIKYAAPTTCGLYELKLTVNGEGRADRFVIPGPPHPLHACRSGMARRARR